MDTHKRERSKPTKSSGRTVTSTVNAIHSNSLAAVAHSLPVTPERRMAAMQHSSSPVARIVTGPETLGGTTNVKRKVPRLAGKRQPGKPFSVNLGATTSKQTCSRTYLGRNALPTAVGGSSTGRLNRHGGVPPIVLTSATTNSDNSNDSGLGFDRSGSSTKLDKHHQIADGAHQPGYGATPDSYQPSSIVPYNSAGMLDGQQQAQTGSSG
uniref:Uncharacterized protein n=1 Tax=Anopheles maculatus TaxID=74869 RepID=A0A182TBS2_9DIPT